MIASNILCNSVSRFLGQAYFTDISVSGTASLASLSAIGDITAGGNLYSTTGNLYLKNLLAINGQSDTWLRINANNAFTSGIYFGTSIVRTDGTLQVGSSGAYLKSNSTNTTIANLVTPTATITTGAITTLTASDVNANNVSVANNLHATHFDLQTVAQLGGSFYVSPTVKFPNSGTTLGVAKSGATLTLTITDSSITSTTMAGIVWTANSRVKVSGTINGVVTGTMDGTVSSINTSSHVLTLSVSGENSGSVVAGTYSASQFSDLSVMVYQRRDGSNDYRVGIWMNCYDLVNSSSTIRIYGGTSALPNVMLGNLTSAGLGTVNGLTPTGFGLFAQNAFLHGCIVSTEGQIGGWTIGSTKLYNNTDSLTSQAVGIYLGTDGIRNFASTSQYVNITGGKITALGVDVSGKITATSGAIGGFEINSTAIKTLNVAVTSNADNSISLSSADFTRTINSTSRAGLRFAIGDKFGVTGDGVIYAGSAVISGTLTAGADSKIGPWTVTATSIYKTSSTMGNATAGAAYFGDDGLSITDKFKVSAAGAMTATSGSIAGWRIESTYLATGTATAPAANTLLLCPAGTVSSYTVAGTASTGWMITAGTTFGVTKNGGVYATSGSIAGWSISTNSLGTGTWGTENGVLLCTGSAGAKSIGGSESISGWTITSGAKFGVTKAGVVYGSDVHLTGEITATSGTIGGASITNGVLKIAEANISGTLSANVIDASSLTIGQSQVTNLTTDLAGKASTSSVTTLSNKVSAIYGTCNTAATTQAKAVTCSNFELFSGALITVTFSTANTYASDAVQLNINSKGAKNIWVANAVTSASNQLLWGAGAVITFRYDGTQFIVVGEPRNWYGASTTAAATAAKTDTTVATGCVVCKGTIVSLSMTNDNTATAPTLNIASTGAKNLYAGNSTTRPLTSNGLGWTAGSTTQFIFDGQYWRVGDTAGLARAYSAQSTANTANTNATNAAKTATNFITADSSGIKVHNTSNTTDYVHITSDGTAIYKGGSLVSNFATDITLGQTSGTNRNVFIDADSGVSIRKGTTVLANYGDTITLNHGTSGKAALTLDSTNGLKMFKLDGTTLAAQLNANGLIVSAGYIGGTSGFTITSGKMYSSTHSAYNTAVAGVYIGTDYISLGSGGVTYFKNDGTGKVGPWTLSTTYFRNGNIASATNTTVAGVYLGTDGLNISNGTTATTSYITKSAVNIGNKLTWNGTTLSVEGTITANTGYIGGTSGWTIASQKLYSGTLGSDTSMYLGTTDLGAASIGGSPATTSTNPAPISNWRLAVGSGFGVTSDGTMYCNKAKVSGVISAGSGSTIGPWTISDTAIYKVNATMGNASTGATYFGNDGLSITDKFKVTSTGALTATSAILGDRMTFNYPAAGDVYGGDVAFGPSMSSSSSYPRVVMRVTADPQMYFLTTNGKSVLWGVEVDDNATAGDRCSMYCTNYYPSETTTQMYFNGNIEVCGTSGDNGIITADKYDGRVVTYNGYAYTPVGSGSNDGEHVAIVRTNAGVRFVAQGQFNNSKSYSAYYVNMTSSDIRLKENIKDTSVTDALSVVNKMKIREFDWKCNEPHQKIGFIADELEELDSNLTLGGGYDEDGEMIVKSIDTLPLNAYMVKAIQELSAKVEEQAAEIERLKAGR